MKHSFFNPVDYNNHSKLQYDFAHEILKSATISSTDRVLDIGCGDGKITLDIAEKFAFNGQVTGVDLSSHMIDYAYKTHGVGKNRNLGFMVMDAESIVFKNQFDVVVSFCCLHWVRDQLSALKGIKNSLSNDGRCYLLVPLRHEKLYAAIEKVSATPPWNEHLSDFQNPHVFFTKEEYSDLVKKSDLELNSLVQSEMDYLFDNKTEMEAFLKAWLPHVNKIPAELQDIYMNDIGDEFIRNNPHRNGSVKMPLTMLKVCATNSLNQTLELENHHDRTTATFHA